MQIPVLKIIINGGEKMQIGNQAKRKKKKKKEERNRWRIKPLKLMWGSYGRWQPTQGLSAYDKF